MEFKDLRLAPGLLAAVEAKGFTEATPIQEKVIPLLLQGSDVIGQAKTGTGKTAAFGLATLHLLSHNFNHRLGVVALVLTPTRELAVQVADEINSLGKGGGDHALAIYGGADINGQIRALSRGPRIVVGTPGRILDHLERRTLDLSRTELLVIDEADRMLDMGFIDDVRRIVRHIPPSRQMALFSATMPPEILSLSREFMHDPEFVKASGDEVNVSGIKQHYVSVEGRVKLSALANLLRKYAPKKAIIFCRTKHGADKLAGLLHRLGFDSLALHGNLTQNARDRAMTTFEAGHVQILVATDLASRGLDIVGVDMVVNFDLPEDEKIYLHRIGRTGRAGAVGSSFTFVTNLGESRMVKSWENRIGATITEEAADVTRADFVREEKRSEARPQNRGSPRSRFGRRDEGRGQRGGGFNRGPRTGDRRGPRREARRGEDTRERHTPGGQSRNLLSGFGKQLIKR